MDPQIAAARALLDRYQCQTNLSDEEKRSEAAALLEIEVYLGQLENGDTFPGSIFHKRPRARVMRVRRGGRAMSRSAEAALNQGGSSNRGRSRSRPSQPRGINDSEEADLDATFEDAYDDGGDGGGEDDYNTSLPRPGTPTEAGPNLTDAEKQHVAWSAMMPTLKAQYLPAMAVLSARMNHSVQASAELVQALANSAGWRCHVCPGIEDVRMADGMQMPSPLPSAAGEMSDTATEEPGRAMDCGPAEHNNLHNAPTGESCCRSMTEARLAWEACGWKEAGAPMRVMHITFSGARTIFVPQLYHSGCHQVEP
jgi:hypothetical protein